LVRFLASANAHVIADDSFRAAGPVMEKLFTTVLPLALASAVSPASLAVSLAILGGRNHPRLKAFAYLLGGALVASAVVVLGLLLSGNLGATPDARVHDKIDVGLGSLLLVLGVAALAIKPSKNGSGISSLDSQSAARQVATCGLMGLLAMGLNVSSLVPFFAAVRDVGRAAVSIEVKGAALTVATALILAPMILPLAIYLIAPNAAGRILRPISTAATKYGRFLVAAICLAVGAYFVWKGWHGL
jgi:hypothetical protein